MKNNTSDILQIEKHSLETESVRSKEIESPGKLQIDTPYSWLMVFAGFMLNFMTLGTQAIYGVFLAHYTKYEFTNESGSFLTLMGGVGPALFAIFSLPSGILVANLGFRFNIFSAGIIFGLGLIAASFGTALWHLLIGQAILVGISVGLCFVPTVSIVPQWFDKYRGLAVGITSAGSGVGGLVLAPLMQAIIDSIGWRWALRINGIMGSVILIISGIILKQRVPFQPLKYILDKGVITDKRFIAMWFMGLASCFAFWAPFFITPLYCSYHGISHTTASLIVGVMNAATAVGRIINGRVLDKIGNINTLMLCHFVAGLSFVLIWNFATQVWSIVIFAIVYGLSASAFFPISALIAAQLFGLDKLAKVNGPFYTCCAPGNLLCTFIATTIVATYTTTGYINYLPCQLYMFACYMLSTLCLVWLKWHTSKKIFVKI